MLLAPLAGALGSFAQTPVLTQHNDNMRSGLNSSETILTAANVNVNQFGKVYSFPVDGQVHAQPLYVPNVQFPGNVIHNVLIVATENDSVYAFDADGASAAPIWQVSMVDAAHGAGPGELPLNAVAETGCSDLTPLLGITSTPVIDLNASPTPTIFVEANSIGTTGSPIYRLHALDLTTGNEQPQGPAVISATVSGTGDGSQAGSLPFNPLMQHGRSGLLLSNGVLYIAYGSHCDYTPYHGWLFAYDETTLAQTSVFATTPNAGYGGVWMGGAGPAADSNGYVYLATGNGVFDTTAPVTDFGDTVLKFSSVDGNGNNGILGVADYFTPFEQETLFGADLDLASGGILLLPDQPGNYPHLLVSAGKEGKIYLINRDQMTNDPSNPGQEEPYCSTCTTSDSQIVEESSLHFSGGIFGAPAYWNGNLYYWGNADTLRSIPVSNGLLNFAGVTLGDFVASFPGAIPSISSNGNLSGTAIVWANTSAALYAYDAENISHALWTSAQATNGRDHPGGFVKYSATTIANGRVYVGTASEVDAYGLLPAVTPASATLQQGGSQQFTANMPGASWSISPANAGSISPTGFYTAPAAVYTSQTVTITASVPWSSASAVVNLVPTVPIAGVATFVTMDSITQGNWSSAYGADGYSLANSVQSLPAYDPSLAVSNQHNWTWASSTADPRALAVTGTGTRIAAAWYSGTSFSFDVNIADGQSHQVALYALDWDNRGRSETVQIIDASAAQLGVLDKETITNFTNGVYLVWNISGHVTITVTSNNPPNAVISGVFFGTAASSNGSGGGSGGGTPSPTATATFTDPNTTTQGNWIGAYGSDGYAITPAFQSLPAYASAVLPSLSWTWATSTSDPRALQTPGGTGRTASTWYGAPNCTMSVNLTDGQPHMLALYLLDWDNKGRAETVQVLDTASGIQLDSETVSAFSTGIYLVWKVSGSVQIVITSTAGPNAVVSGMFFDPVEASLSTPNLKIAKSHTGNFTQDQQGATYTINVSNAANAAPNTGTVTVTDTVPSGLTLVSMSGTGWDCTAGNSCTRGDTLNGGASYPPITVTVNVASNASSPQVNQASLASNGGSTIANASDTTTIQATGSAVATFANQDTLTEGNWQSLYGADGYALAGVTPQNIPSYATFTPQNSAAYTWTSGTTDPRALSLPGGAGGIAAAWYGKNMSFDLNLTDGQSHLVALYALDWDNKGRSETIQISDAVAGNILSTQTVNNFSNGTYLIWNVMGHVTIVVTSVTGPNTVISGIFFGGSLKGSSSGGSITPAVATFAGTDTATQGNWIGVYGSNGHSLPNFGQSFAIAVTLAEQNQLNWTWAASTTDPRALEINTQGARAAATWYNAPSFTLDVNLTDGQQHQISLYVIDWDSKGRTETVQVTDANLGTTLDTRAIPNSNTSTTSSNFVNGTYLKWNVTGHVKLVITNSAGPNAVVSGIFFD